MRFFSIKPLLILTLFLPLFFSVSLLPPEASAQGFIYCSERSFSDTCEEDYLQGDDPNAFVECEPGFEPPASCSDDPSRCCTEQTSSCDNVECVSSTDDEPSPCRPGWRCTTRRVLNCSNEGGDVQNCTNNGTTGNCCLPPLPPRCPDNYQCVNDASCDCQFCNQRGCSTPGGVVGNCCEPVGSLDTQCAIGGGRCEEGGAEACDWNEIEINLTCAGYPDGTVCCDEFESIETCPPGSTSGGTCRDSCGPDESEYLSANECMEFGQECCLTTPALQINTPIYCDGEGGKTTDPNATGNLYTAIGCIPIGDPNDFLGFILSWALGIAGGVAFLMIIYSGFQIVTSAGDPGKVKSGKELLTAAIGGLLLILFAAFILNLIGVDILQIPGFGG